MAARSEPVLNFTANTSDDEVEFPRGAAEEPVLAEETLVETGRPCFESESDIQRLVFKCAKEQLQQRMPTVLEVSRVEDYKKLESDRYCWKKTESNKRAHGARVDVHSTSLATVQPRRV